MPRQMSGNEVDELIGAARTFCETRAVYEIARREGRLNDVQDEAMQMRLRELDERVTMLKSSNELVRRRARLRVNVTSMLDLLERKAIK